VNSGAIVTARRLITVAIVFVTVAISAITSMDAASAADLTAWNAKTSMSTPRYGHSVATGVDGAIYVFGGTNSVDAALASVERYDTATNTWSARAHGRELGQWQRTTARYMSLAVTRLGAAPH
jgi:N-acetylneuraminic acid mutarotase